MVDRMKNCLKKKITKAQSSYDRASMKSINCRIMNTLSFICFA